MANFALLSPQAVEHQVNDKLLRFYTVRPRTAARLSKTISKLAGALSTLLADNSSSDISSEEMKDGGASNLRISAISPELAELRTTQRRMAVEDAINTLFDERQQTALVELIMDSLRDDCPRKPSGQDIEKFQDDMDMSTYIELLTGMAKANAKVFGDLGKGLFRAFKAKAEGLIARAEGTDG